MKIKIGPIQICASARYFTTSTTVLKASSSSSNRWLNRQNNDFYTKRAKAENLKSRAAFKLLQIDERFNIFGKSKSKNAKSAPAKPNNNHTHGRPLNVLDLGAAPGAWNQVALERCPHGSKILGVDILPYQPPNGASSLQGNILSKGTHELIKNFFRLSDFEKKNKVFEEVEIISAGGRPVEKIESDVSIVEQEVELNQMIERRIKDETQNELEKDKEMDLKLLYPVDIVLSDMYVPFTKYSGYSSATTNNPYYRMANTTGLTFKDHMMSMDLCDAALITAVDLLKKNGSLVIKFFTGEEDKLLEKRLSYAFREVKRFKPKACRLESKECYFVCLGKRDYSLDKVKLFTV